MYTPRDYQIKQRDDARMAIARGGRKILMQGATGSGKTVIACMIIDGAMKKGKRVLFLAHRRELIRQCANKLTESDIEHGVIMSGEDLQDWHPVQAASVDTLRARALSTDKMMLPRADILIIDEAHRSLSKTYRALIGLYPNAVLLGLTATPCRGDGKGLGHIYEEMVCGPPMAELIKRGSLVPLRYFAPFEPDMKGVKTAGGDWVTSQAGERMDKPKLVGDIVEQWLKIASDRQTIVFATTVAHSIHIKESFQQAEIRVAHIDATTPTEERDDILDKFARRSIQVLCNVMVLTEGWDCPIASVCVLARPTKSIGLYMQMVGRIMRPLDNKQDALVIDHAGNVRRHGFAEDITEWDLDDSGKIQDREAEKREGKEPTEIMCEQCFCVFTRRHNCPQCGHVNARRGRYLDTEEGDLFEIGKKKPLKKTWTKEQKQLWFSMFLGYGRAKQYPKWRGWAKHSYKRKFGVWPNRLHETEAIPNAECRAYIRHLNIRAAKARKTA